MVQSFKYCHNREWSKTMVVTWHSYSCTIVVLHKYHGPKTVLLVLIYKKDAVVRFYIKCTLIKTLNNRIIIIMSKCRQTGRRDTFTSERRVRVRGRRSAVLQRAEPGAVVLDHGDLILLLGQERRGRIFFCMNSVVGGGKAKVVSHV